MRYQELLPHRALRPYIRSYYVFGGITHLRENTFRGKANKTVGETITRFPSDGGPEMIVNLGDPFMAGVTADALETCRGIRIIGPLSRNLITRITGHTAIVAARFLPGMTAPFFRCPSGMLSDTSVDLETLWGPQAGNLVCKLADARDPDDIRRILDQVFLNHLNETCIHDSRIMAAVETVLMRSGQISIEELACLAGLSRRQFERRFINWVGIAPKRLCRIVRFTALFNRVGARPNLGWADLAADFGYSDQAHFIKDCNFFTGFSPAEWLEKRSPLEQALFSGDGPMTHFYNTSGIPRATMPP